jgi:hypothetical protein
MFAEEQRIVRVEWQRVVETGKENGEEQSTARHNFYSRLLVNQMNAR